MPCTLARHTQCTDTAPCAPHTAVVGAHMRQCVRPLRMALAMPTSWPGARGTVIASRRHPRAHTHTHRATAARCPRVNSGAHVAVPYCGWAALQLRTVAMPSPRATVGRRANTTSTCRAYAQPRGVQQPCHARRARTHTDHTAARLRHDLTHAAPPTPSPPHNRARAPPQPCGMRVRKSVCRRAPARQVAGTHLRCSGRTPQ